MDSLRRYVADEYKDKKKQEMDTTQWKIRWVVQFRLRNLAELRLSGSFSNQSNM